MPHFDSHNVVQHVTYRLADSLPHELRRQLEDELRTIPAELQDRERRRRIEDWMDAGFGSCFLRDPVAARLVQDSLRRFDGERYRLLAWVVMPNHVHVLFQTRGGWTMSRIVSSWKSFTGRRLAQAASRSDLEQRIWHREYWDRYVRDEAHLSAVRDYIHENPVKARLVSRSVEWEWSSARLEPGDPRGEV